MNALIPVSPTATPEEVHALLRRLTRASRARTHAREVYARKKREALAARIAAYKEQTLREGHPWIWD
jgi:siderophore synthetase component